MKNILKISIAALSGVMLLASCSKDYMNTTPTSSTATPTIFESTENAALAINGICKLMTRQYLSSQGFNGEGTIKMYTGEYPGDNCFVNLPGWSAVINGTMHDNKTTIYNYYNWYYYYMLIGNANAIILNIDNAKGAEAERQFIKAQALSFRAYSYMMLLQVYSVRWGDSNNGAADGVVLRLDTSTEEMPLSTMADCYKQIYDDLDEAIRLYTESGLAPDSKDNYSPNIDMAYATYARAALNRQDYATALDKAVKARENHPLMSNDEYKSGFNTPNKEWIWSCYGSADETLFYYSYFANMAYNSSASMVRNYPRCINKNVYDRIPETDIRRGMFLDPKDYTYTKSTGVAGKELTAYARTLYPDIYSTAKVYAYMQFKVSSTTQPGVGHLNNFRSAEMYLIEAEANYFLKNEKAAQASLNTLTRDSGRDKEYNCTATGTALLDEIKLYRKIELFGEGFNWFDLKRWGDSLNRTSTEKGGNYITALAVSYSPLDRNNWTWVIPSKETDYNKLIK